MNTRRVLIAVLASAALAWAIWQAARTGIARTLSEYAEKTDETAAADRAVTLSPADAETHYVRGGVLQQTNDYPQAVEEFRRAVQLRPRDYYLWLALGIAEDQNGDQEAALRDLKQSAALAPTYAQAPWQLGNLLLRMGQPDQAFVELRKAAASNPTVLPNVIDLAWGIYGGDRSTVLAAVPPQTDAARLELAIFFARHQQSTAAADQFLSAGAPPSTKAEALLTELLTARAFGDAYRVWARMHGLSSAGAVATIRDAGFESPVTMGEPGFGWQIAPDIPNVTMSVDATEHQSGSKSLRIEFHGNSNPSQALLTQLILVKPQTKYHLSFAVMARDIVSAGLPVISVRDASDSAHALLGQSLPLRSDVTGWRDFSIDITTGAKTEAILLSVERQNCNADPCPAFGTLWLDSFLIEAR
ncbi:MAG TPA: tetratricopeptide repeat protein [Pyrinomonadaceae bacterium]|nr:tetratricopeptide repeat protein [Pyrinomonadaceae bacterium]